VPEEAPHDQYRPWPPVFIHSLISLLYDVTGLMRKRHATRMQRKRLRCIYRTSLRYRTRAITLCQTQTMATMATAMTRA